MTIASLGMPATERPKIGGPERSAPDFNGLARIYRWMELFTFGAWLQRCRCAFLADLADCRSALILGDGDGRFTAQLLRVNSLVEVDAVDASSAMLRALLGRIGPDAARVRAHHEDARAWQPAHAQFDLVVSHFVLDCLTTAEIRALASTVRGAIAPSGIWAVSEFVIPAGAFGRFVARPLVWFLYRAFGLLTGLSVRRLPDHCAAMSAAGFELRRRHTWLRGLLTSELWTLK